MLNWIGSYFVSPEPSIITNNLDNWYKWQQEQKIDHFLKSHLNQYIKPKKSQKNLYLQYCFGDFINLIYFNNEINEINYIKLLIDFYDNCKGYLRCIKGDSQGILLLRNVILTENIDELYNHNFKSHYYYYPKIHAHTIAYYSLSTLILFLISNYMYFRSFKSDNFPFIDVEECKKSYFNKQFGDISYINPITINKSNTITINKNDTLNNTKQFNSWPGHLNSNIPQKCDVCKKVCENYWGKFRHCLDCHLYRVCIYCGSETIEKIGKDNYPRCILHKNV